jgi:MoaA/NifB/PqqE/SkfB family radical SAM enzyme
MGGIADGFCGAFIDLFQRGRCMMGNIFTECKEMLRTFLAAHLPNETRQFIKKLFLQDKRFKCDATIQWAIQDDVCNLRCEYCRFDHLVKAVPAGDAKCLIETMDKTGLIFNVAVCGNGETFLVPNIIEILQALTKKHYVSLVSNLSLRKVGEFCEKIDPKKVIDITASLHIKELERTGLTDLFIENYLLCEKKGFKIRAQEVAHPNLLGEVDKYKRFFGERGVRLYFDDCFIQFEGKTYPDAYTDEERKTFGLIKKQDSMDRIYQKGKLCNAGYNVFTVAIDGKVYPCPGIKDMIGDVRQGNIGFRKELIRCPNDKCLCPINFLFDDLLLRAREKTKTLS